MADNDLVLDLPEENKLIPNKFDIKDLTNATDVPVMI